MVDVRIIDGDAQPEYGSVYGLLCGASDKDGGWSIDLLTDDGLMRFTSSDPGSAPTVLRVAEILRGDCGLENPNRTVMIRNGCLQMEAGRTVPFSNSEEQICLEGKNVVLAAREVYSLIEDCFETEQALLSAINQVAERGGVQLLAQTDHVELNDGTLIEWTPRLHVEDIPVLVRVLLIRDNLPNDSDEIKALYARFEDSLTRLASLRFEFTRGKDGGLISYAFGMFEDEVIDISLIFDLFFLRQSWTATALIQVAKVGLPSKHR